MAKETIVRLVDDIDGSEATETVSFSFKGASYEIDLNATHLAAMTKVLEPYVNAAAKVSTRTGSAVRPKRVSTGVDLSAVRAWAASNGIKVADRGRVAADVIEQFKAAGN